MRVWWKKYLYAALALVGLWLGGKYILPVLLPFLLGALLAVAAEPVVPFNQWAEVLDYIAKQSPPLYGVLMDSTAMSNGQELIIVTDNELFGTLVRQDSNKTVLVNAVQAVTGHPMRIKRGRPAKQEKAEETDPLSAFLRQSSDAGITVEMKG